MAYIVEYNLECERCHTVVECDPEVDEYWCKCKDYVHYYRPSNDPDEPLIELPMPKTWKYKEYKVAVPDFADDKDIPFDEATL